MSIWKVVCGLEMRMPIWKVGVVGRSASELWEVCKWVVGEFDLQVVEIGLGMLVLESRWVQSASGGCERWKW